MIRRTMDATFLNTVANDLKTKARDAIIAEIDRQHREEDAAPFVGDGFTPDVLVIDGTVNVEKIAQAALQAIHDAGFAVVPREPTEAMFEAGFDATSVELHPGEHPDDVNNPAVCWRAMLSASQPKTEEG